MELRGFRINSKPLESGIVEVSPLVNEGGERGTVRLSTGATLDVTRGYRVPLDRLIRAVYEDAQRFAAGSDIAMVVPGERDHQLPGDLLGREAIPLLYREAYLVCGESGERIPLWEEGTMLEPDEVMRRVTAASWSSAERARGMVLDDKAAHEGALAPLGGPEFEGVGRDGDAEVAVGPNAEPEAPELTFFQGVEARIRSLLPLQQAGFALAASASVLFASYQLQRWAFG